MDNSYRACVIGRTGRGGYGHNIEDAFTGHPRVTVVAVADDDRDAAAAVAERLGAPRSYGDWQAMLAQEQPDLVAIGPRWVDARREMVVACAGAGVRGIFCEKPFAASLADADAMVAACAQAGTRLQMAHQLRVTGQIMQAYELVRRGEIGEVVALYGRGKEDTRGGGEDFIVLGVHILNLMRWFGGDAQWAFGRVAVGDRDALPGDVHEAGEPVGPICGDNVAALWGFPGGAVGRFDSRRDQARGYSRMSLLVQGSEGAVSIINDGERRVHISRRSLHDPDACAWEPIRDPEWPAVPPEQRMTAGNRLLAADLISAIEEGREPICGATDARAITEMIVSAYASHIARARVELPMAADEHPLLRWTGAAQSAEGASEP